MDPSLKGTAYLTDEYSNLSNGFRFQASNTLAAASKLTFCLILMKWSGKGKAFIDF